MKGTKNADSVSIVCFIRLVLIIFLYFSELLLPKNSGKKNCTKRYETVNNDEKQCSNGMKRLVTVSNDMEQSIDRSR